MRTRILAAAFLSFVLVIASRPAFATDVDGGTDCGRVVIDFGDAPEGVALPWGPMAHFPTCLALTPPGNQTASCPPLSGPPGPTGYMEHFNAGTSHYWMGCFKDSQGGLYGIDSELDGKFANGVALPSVCDPGITTDCVSAGPFGPVGGDECLGDGSDSGLLGASYFLICGVPNNLAISTANCGMERIAYLNVLADFNSDGDWNDVVPCNTSNTSCPCPPAACYPEWVVKNKPVTIAIDCGLVPIPPFQVPFTPYGVWMRISLTDGPVADDYPWAGSANQPNGTYDGGETEDYMFGVTTGLPVNGSSWGGLKVRYR